MLVTLFGYAGTMLLALHGRTDMLASVFGHAGNMQGGKRPACILVTESGSQCAGIILVAVHGPTCMLTTVLGYAGTILLAVHGRTDITASAFGHAGSMLVAVYEPTFMLATVFGYAGQIGNTYSTAVTGRGTEANQVSMNEHQRNHTMHRVVLLAVLLAASVSVCECTMAEPNSQCLISGVQHLKVSTKSLG